MSKISASMVGILAGGMVVYAVVAWVFYDVDISGFAGLVGVGAVIGGALGARFGGGAAKRQETGDARR